MSKSKPTLTCWGGVGSVTGANFLLAIASKKILIDCGLEQGTSFAEERNCDPFPYDPASIDFLFVTHAHADHIGRIPKLVRDGFKGVIYSTPATLDLARVMLPDTLRIIEEEARHKGTLAMYEDTDVENAFKVWKTIPYYETQNFTDDLSVCLKDSGHILGSAMVEFEFKYHPRSSEDLGTPPLELARPDDLVGRGEGQGEVPNRLKIVFTGDLGNSPSLFLRDTDNITDADYLVMESVYGDRNHESKEERRRLFRELVKDTVKRKRTLVIPAFSLERTQDILFELNHFIESDRVGDVRVYIDSPLATKVTDIYRGYSNEFKDSAREMIAHGDDLFDFPKLKFTVEREQSERIDLTANPKIIIAGSGMSNGGRIMHHERRYLPDRNATLLLMGYQAAGTLGRRIFEGAKKVKVDGEEVKINAEIKSIMGYSSHKDSNNLVEFVGRAQGEKTLKKVFVTMGEPKAALFLTQRLRDYLGTDAVCPTKGEAIELDL